MTAAADVAARNGRSFSVASAPPPFVPASIAAASMYQGGYLVASRSCAEGCIHQIWPSGTLTTYTLSGAAIKPVLSREDTAATPAADISPSFIRADPAGAGGGYLLSDETHYTVYRIGDTGDTVLRVAGGAGVGSDGDGGPAALASIEQRGLDADGIVSRRERYPGGCDTRAVSVFSTLCAHCIPIPHPSLFHCRAASTL